MESRETDLEMIQLLSGLRFAKLTALHVRTDKGMLKSAAPFNFNCVGCLVLKERAPSFTRVAAAAKLYQSFAFS